MPPRQLRTIDLARALGVHVNTIRLYESWGLLPALARAPNGYRLYTSWHLEHARLAHLTVRWPYLGDKSRQVALVKTAAQGDLGMAMELAYTHLALVRMERTLAESAIEFLERWAAGYLIERPQQRVCISVAARHLQVSVDMLRNWERNGLITVPRDPHNQYRLYGTTEFGRLRVIRTLVKAGYSLMAILRMLLSFDTDHTADLRAALDTPRADEERNMYALADSWLSTLVEQETRAQAIIRQIGHLIELAHER